jgi:TonB family protein
MFSTPQKKKRDISKEEQFGLSVSVGVHLVLLILFILVYSKPEEQDRSAFIEITLGEFQDGSPAQQAEQRNPEVATRPNPQPRPVDNPQPEPEPEPQPQVEPEDITKPVELPEQTEPVIHEEVIESPKTELIEPEETEVEPKPREDRVPDPVQVPDEVERRGSLLSGDRRGTTGDMSAEQGTSRDRDRSAPYELRWEGDIDRQPIRNPLPNYTSEVEAIITIRFTVRPNGTVGELRPLRRTDPALEDEVMRTLRSWSFNRLPSNAPQVDQVGVITFRFVLN